MKNKILYEQLINEIGKTIYSKLNENHSLNFNTLNEAEYEFSDEFSKKLPRYFENINISIFTPGMLDAGMSLELEEPDSDIFNNFFNKVKKALLENPSTTKYIKLYLNDRSNIKKCLFKKGVEELINDSTKEFLCEDPYGSKYYKISQNRNVAVAEFNFHNQFINFYIKYNPEAPENFKWPYANKYFREYLNVL